MSITDFDSVLKNPFDSGFKERKTQTGIRRLQLMDVHEMDATLSEKYIVIIHRKLSRIIGSKIVS